MLDEASLDTPRYFKTRFQIDYVMNGKPDHYEGQQDFGDGDECVCPQLISYSLLCKWFRIAVLPADKELYAELYHAEDMRRCSVCGSPFASSSNRAIYCPDCRKRITRRQTAERMRKMRANVTR